MSRYRCPSCHTHATSHGDAPWCTECWTRMQPMDPSAMVYDSDDVPDELREVERLMQEPRTR